MQTTAELTGRQREIWSFLVEYVDRHGYPPTVREIGGAVGLASPSTVHAHLANLERAGLLRRDPTKPRALELVGRDKGAEAATAQLPKLPLLGQIAAGGPLLAEQNVEDEIAVPENLRGDFLLRVKGDSMIEAGILEGDVVVVRRAQDARDGEIVVALAGDRTSRPDEASTVKQFFTARAAVSGCKARELRARGRSTPRTSRSSARSWGVFRGVMSTVATLHRTLEQELLAKMLRGRALDVPGLRRVRPPRGRTCAAAPSARCACTAESKAPRTGLQSTGLQSDHREAG